MKVLHITISNKGGAGIAALRLHTALVENGVQSAFLSKNETIDFANKKIDDSFFKYKKLSLMQRVFKKLELLFNFSKERQYLSKIEKVKSRLDCEIYSLPFSKIKLHQHPLVQEADILNFHWMGGVLDYQTFFRNCNKPIVWTLHDMNPFLGIFHYENDTIANSGVIGELDEIIRKEKSLILEKSSISAIVTPSKWMLQAVCKHNFLPNKKRIVIPNSIDFSVFENLNSNEIREEYKIHEDDFVILFVADSIENKRKGFDLLLKALVLIEHLPLTLVTVGKGTLQNIKFKNVSLGTITDLRKMASCYVMSDVFVLPSREDNLPNVMLESFAAGTPVISFFNGGMSEYIVEEETGYVVSSFTPEDLANTIEKIYNNRVAFSKTKIKEYAFANFNFNKQAEGYKKIYKESIKKK